MVKELCYVSGNRSKFELLKNYLALHQVIVSNSAVDFVEEQTLDIKKIAIAKAKHAWSIVKKPLMVDDCGFYFSQYDRFPGVLSKFVFQGLGYDGLYKLYNEGDLATFESCVVFIDAMQNIFVYEGIVHGWLTKPKDLTVSDSIAYANLFVPQQSQLSLARLVKQTGYSEFDPRVQALKKFIAEHVTP